MFVRVQTEGQQSPRHHGRSYLTPYHYRGLNWESECCLKTSKLYYASPCLIFNPFSVPTCFPPLLLHFPHLPSVFIIFNFYLPSASFICPLFKMTSLLKKGERVKVNLGRFLGKIRQKENSKTSISTQYHTPLPKPKIFLHIFYSNIQLWKPHYPQSVYSIHEHI